jgi:nucleotide-binding universal stress UspA family protein
MYHRILMPIDGSACSDAALAHGLRLAKEQGAEVRIIHALDTEGLYVLYEGLDADDVAERWSRAGTAILERAAAQARESGVPVATALVEDRDRIADVIVAEAKQWAADLIVMGTHGRHGFDHLLLGSAAEGVMRTTPVPVLLIRKT